MTLHVDNVVSEITAEPESSIEGPPDGLSGQFHERLRAEIIRQEHLKMRVYAEGMDD